MSETGIPTPELQKLPNIEILIKARKLQILCKVLERMLVCLKEASNVIQQLNGIKTNYTECLDLFETQLNLIEKDEIFNEDKIKELKKEATLYTKTKIIQDYKIVETKYADLSEYYSLIDKNYYNEVLNDVCDEMF